ncbi:MAG: hypothetical protein KC680_03885 [Candidatus Peregrinibacteria bacterium]|nr:hypothetical protein [Candidatus Peregrinibacteria bacterium]
MFTPSVYAVGEVEQTCEEKYPISRTESSPRQFLLRRCIQNERKKLINERQAERQQMRDAARYDKSAARSQALRTLSENTTQDAIRRQNLKEQRFRARTNTIDKTPFYEARQSRRSLIRGTEGVDRINAIRRKMMSTQQIDPCTTVAAIRKFNNPCSRYGTLRNTEGDVRSPYLQ